MKTPFAFLLAAALFASDAFAADVPSPAILAQSTKNGVTTLVTTGRVQAEAAINADGSVTFQIYPSITRIDSAGEVITPPTLDTSAVFNVPLSATLVAQVLTEVKAAYLADLAAKAAAKAAAATPPATP